MSIRAVCACLLAAVTFGACACGGGSAHARSPCPRRVAAVLGAGARAALVSRDVDRVTCLYRARGGAAVRVTVDTAPQVRVRWGRWLDERGQAYLGAPRAELPEVLEGIGDGAAWVPAARELVATGRGRLVTVVVLHGAAHRRTRATAVAAARAALAG